MRIWRDVMSVTAWNEVASRVHASAGYGTKLGLGLRAKSVVKHRYRSPEDFMASIGKRLAAYHAIPKRDVKQLHSRIDALGELSHIAADYLQAYNISDAVAKTRVATKAGLLGFDGKPADESVDRNILTLARRAPRKVEYIHRLGQYYSKTGAGRRWRDASALINFATAAQEKTNSKVGLVPYVRLEQIDFMHRGDYEEIKDYFTSVAAFKEWMGDATAHSTPFFLWLEGHPVCLEDDKGTLSAQSVNYYQAEPGKQVNTLSKLKLVSFDNPLRATDLTHPSFPTGTASTVGYKADKSKDPCGNWGMDVAAYVWTEARELFIAEHRPFNFHHSSFLSGNRVRCAGMIVIKNGEVKGLSNNSGHYQPGKEHLLKLYMALRQTGVLPPTACIEVHTATGCHKVTAADFWKNYFTF